jgi:hypothetical protein
MRLAGKTDFGMGLGPYLTLAVLRKQSLKSERGERPSALILGRKS